MGLNTHDVYVAKGYCPAISTIKSWCCYPDGHAGTHMSLRLLPNGSFMEGIRWA